MNKKYMILCSVLMFGAFAAAAWLLSYESNLTGFSIMGTEGEMLFTDSFGVTETNDTSAFSKSENLTITNNNGVASLVVGLNTTITDVNDECDNSGDVEVVVEYEGGVLEDGDVIVVENGQYNITSTTSVVSRSCPQSVESFITLEQA